MTCLPSPNSFAARLADLVGEGGTVVSLDFSATVTAFKRNMQLNPALASRIRFVQKALWSSTGKVLGFDDYGPGTAVESIVIPDRKTVSSVTIDDLVDEQGLKRVDMIKMDIEGAEVEALKGARETIQRFGPKLAVTVYHNQMHNMISVPETIMRIAPGYQMYLAHFTTYHEETVLFAQPQGKFMKTDLSGST